MRLHARSWATRCALTMLFFAGTMGAFVQASAVAACPNEEIRQAQGVAYLPDCMGLEMVSPPKKFNQRAGAFVVSASGERVLFSSIAGLADTPGLLDGLGDFYVSTREASGWTTAPTSPPAGQAYGWGGGEPRGFTPDYTRWFWISSTASLAEEGSSQAFQAGLGGLFAPLSPPLIAAGGGAVATVTGSRFQGASADHSHLFFQPGGRTPFTSPFDMSTSYLPGDPKPVTGTGADFNTYVARRNPSGDPTLELLARDGEDKTWGGNCGTRVGGIGGFGIGERNQGAISPDGSRVYFSTRPSQPPTGDCNVAGNKLRILRRLETGAGPWITSLVQGPSGACNRVAPPCDPADGDDLYQGASADGTKVYFTTNRQLADSDLDGTGAECSATTAVPGCDLYLYDSSLPQEERLIQVSAGEDVPTKHEAGKEAEVLNAIAAISGDGSHVYFVAEGVLTDAQNPEGDEAETGQPNLYAYVRNEDHPEGHIAFIGVVDPDDGSSPSFQLWGRNGTWNGAYPVPAVSQDSSGNEVGGDGHVLLFISEAPLTLDDLDGGHRDVFRYDADAEELERISKAGPGGNDNGAFDVGFRGQAQGSIGTDFAEFDRWTSEDGETIVFRSAEALTTGEVNGSEDSYLWRSGQLFRLPGGAGRAFLSHEGDTVGFTSGAQLVPSDGDSIDDAYVVRAGGGFPIPPESICEPDGDEGCQKGGSPASTEQHPQSPGFVGTGNVRAGKPGKACPKGKRKVRRNGKVRCVKRGNAKRANHDRGGQK